MLWMLRCRRNDFLLALWNCAVENSESESFARLGIIHSEPYFKKRSLPVVTMEKPTSVAWGNFTGQHVLWKTFNSIRHELC